MTLYALYIDDNVTINVYRNFTIRNLKRTFEDWKEILIPCGTSSNRSSPNRRCERRTHRRWTRCKRCSKSHAVRCSHSRPPRRRGRESFRTSCRRARRTRGRGTCRQYVCNMNTNVFHFAASGCCIDAICTTNVCCYINKYIESHVLYHKFHDDNFKLSKRNWNRRRQK